MTRSVRTPRRRVLLVLVPALALAVLGGGATLATRSGVLADESYCWGAWAEDSGPRVLGDDFARAAEESGSPERGQQATCVVAFGVPGTEEMQSPDTSPHSRPPRAGEGSGGHRLVARVGPPPRSTGRARQAWLAEALHGNAAPLPDGLPGVVGPDRGTLVLPEECDSGDVPTVVTVRSEGDVSYLDSEREAAELLLSLAETAQREAGCATGQPARITAPVRTAPGEETYTTGRPACRVPGMRLAPRRGELGGYASAIGDRLHSCSLELTGEDGEADAHGQFVVTSLPRLVTLFAGVEGADSPRAPGAGWRGKGRIDGGDGLVTAECRGRPTVFFLHLDGPLARAAAPDTPGVFARSANSVAERLGCPAVGPRG
ncbi:hypothetical protein MMF93_17865 [Streptomyces tubbatahanensis]|uniref:Secreted protein n=1 Tax=Streptomyces tubbatahanensis TaxID=2923272 RepID=A0ABY3XUM0_9ACTN|nr:hypothetical protein [Streptomyces tubbatahanensis]UNS98115.1 hypothetical protein MMF93_17865 [Streptomyces tubbatahanensis]